MSTRVSKFTYVPVKVLSHSSIWCPSPSWFPRSEEINAVASSSRSTTTTTISTYPTLPPASSSLTTIHNNNNSSNLALGFIQMHRIPFLSASFGLGLEMWEEGEEGMKIRDNYHSIRLLDQRLRRMGFYLLIH